jgi:hypothetical protein
MVRSTLADPGRMNEIPKTIKKIETIVITVILNVFML